MRETLQANISSKSHFQELWKMVAVRLVQSGFSFQHPAGKGWRMVELTLLSLQILTQHIALSQPVCLCVSHTLLPHTPCLTFSHFVKV